MHRICLAISMLFMIQVSSAQTHVMFYTTMGNFEAEMYDSLQPITAGNFISLVNAKFYDGLIFHRVIEGFVIQGGDPTGTGCCGAGYTIPDEFDSAASNVQGALGMANSGPNTGSSQFYINLVDNTYLDPNYPVFGIVDSNFSVVEAIGSVPTNAGDKPLIDVVMDSVRVIDVATGMPIPVGSFFDVIINPNPFSSQTTISIFSSIKVENAELKVFDVLGKEMSKTNFDETGNVILNRYNLKSGVYFYRVLQKNKMMATGKLVVE